MPMNPPLPPYSSAGSEASGPQFLVAQDTDMVLALRRLSVRSGPSTAVDRLRLFGLRERLSKVWLRMVCPSVATLNFCGTASISIRVPSMKKYSLCSRTLLLTGFSRTFCDCEKYGDRVKAVG